MLSVIVAAWGPVGGNRYARFVPRWFSALAAMRPLPAEVVVVHSSPEPLGLLAYPDPPVPVIGVACDGRQAEMLNAGVTAASQSWCSCIGVDDCYMPDALELLPTAYRLGADVMVWNHRERDSDHVWHCHWSPEQLRYANTVQGASPFRKSLWSRIGGFRDLGWCDWAFWLDAAKSGAKALETGRVAVVYDAGHTHETLSGPALAKARRDAHDRQIRELVQELYP